MKNRLLTLLRDQDQIVSGEHLSRKLGISRVAVWKHIQKLNELGYRIVSSARGYRLHQSPDTPFAWEFPSREPDLHFFQKTTSTMDEARRLARAGCPHFSIVVAEQQIKGRGRLKRIWRSSLGGLYFTIVLRPNLSPAESYRVNFLASIGLARVLRQELALEAGIKWPNDIFVKDKKIAGILTEMEAEADVVTFVNIGIGINVNNDPSLKEPAATSLKQLLNRDVSRRQLLAAFLDQFENLMDQVTTFQVIPEWKKMTITLNRPVRIETTQAVFHGVAKDVDESGALILERPDGSTQRVIYGDCFHQTAEGL